MRQSVSIALIAATAGLAHAGIIGSPTIDRNIQDSSIGLSLIYRGATQPSAGDGSVAETFSVFSKGTGNIFSNYWATPLLLEVNAPDQYTVVAIGTSRNLSGQQGVLSFAFDTIAGDPTLQPGKNYSFGYYNGGLTADGTGGTTGVASTQNSGAIPFTGYNDFSDAWSYAFAASPTIGTIFGTGGVNFDSGGAAGRTYSANLSFAPIPAPASAALLALTGLAATRRRR